MNDRWSAATELNMDAVKQTREGCKKLHAHTKSNFPIKCSPTVSLNISPVCGSTAFAAREQRKPH